MDTTTLGGLTRMLSAQGLGEYGAAAGGGSFRIADVVDNIEYTVRHADPTTWVVVFGGVLVVWFLFVRTR